MKKQRLAIYLIAYFLLECVFKDKEAEDDLLQVEKLCYIRQIDSSTDKDRCVETETDFAYPCLVLNLLT